MRGACACFLWTQHFAVSGVAPALIEDRRRVRRPMEQQTLPTARLGRTAPASPLCVSDPKDERTPTPAAVCRAHRSACEYLHATTLTGVVRIADPSPLVGCRLPEARADAGRLLRHRQQAARALAERPSAPRPQSTRSPIPTGPDSRPSRPIRRSRAPTHPSRSQLQRPQVRRYGIDVGKTEAQRPRRNTQRLPNDEKPRFWKAFDRSKRQPR